MSSSWKKDEPPETQWVRLPTKRDPQAAPPGEGTPVARRRWEPARSPEPPPDAANPFAHYDRSQETTRVRKERHGRRFTAGVFVLVLLAALLAVAGVVVSKNLLSEAPEVVG